MDVAIDGVGFFQVERPDGTEAYTRDGAFKVGPDGQITTADALPLRLDFRLIQKLQMYLYLLLAKSLLRLQMERRLLVS